MAARRQFFCTVPSILAALAISRRKLATHPSAAIDRAADRTVWLIGRRIGRDARTFSSSRNDGEEREESVAATDHIEPFKAKCSLSDGHAVGRTGVTELLDPSHSEGQ